MILGFPFRSGGDSEGGEPSLEVIESPGVAESAPGRTCQGEAGQPEAWVEP